MNPYSFSAIGYAVFWLLFILAAGFLTLNMRKLWQYISLGKKEEKPAQMIKRAVIMTIHVVGQWCGFKNLSNKDLASIGHAFIIWGFFLYAIYYLIFIVISSGFGLAATIQNTTFFLVYSWIMEIAAILLIAGSVWAIIRRYIIKPSRLEGEQSFEAAVGISTILLHGIAYLFLLAGAIALNTPPVLANNTPLIATAISSGLSAGTANTVYITFFWIFWAAALLDTVLLTHGSHLHKIAAPFNILLRCTEPKGALKPIDIENSESFGVAKITDFSQKHLLDLYACVTCGRCQDACPAFASQKPLNPKELIQDLLKHLLKVAPNILKGENDSISLVEDVLEEETIWSCTTCRACMEVCPVANEHMPKIVDIRRNLVLEQAQMPETIMGAMKSLESRGHPWRGTVYSRTDWADGLNVKELSQNNEVDILFWVGCTNALDDRCQKIAIDMVKILNAAGINFGTLGEEESCCGDVARRVGNEYLYQIQAQRNIETLKKYNVKKILTTCPHCFNTLKYEYPQFGGHFEVIHHTQFIAKLLKEGKIKSSALMDGKITYHDPCYIGRYSNIYQEPRQVLSSIANIQPVEIDEIKTKRTSFCCGGGGGRCWMDEAGTKISHLRMDNAINVNADVLAVACPLCMIMFEDARKAKEAAENLRVKDIAELVAGTL